MKSARHRFAIRRAATLRRLCGRRWGVLAQTRDGTHTRRDMYVLKFDDERMLAPRRASVHQRR